EYRVDALIVEPIAVHGRKEAHAPQAELAERTRQPCLDFARGGGENEEADEPGMSPAGNRDRRLIAGEAGGEGRPGHAMTIEFFGPAVGELSGVGRIIPAEFVGDRGGAALGRKPWQILRQQLEKV